jgi:opacity protein-like surface antigen
MKTLSNLFNLSLLLILALADSVWAQQKTEDELILEQVQQEMSQPAFRSTVESRTAENRIYVAAFGGANLHQITDSNIDLAPTLPGFGAFNYDDDGGLGPMLGLKVGRTFGRFSIGGEVTPEADRIHFVSAVEGEIFYSNFSSDGVVQHDFPPNVSITAETDLDMVVASVNGILKMQWHWFRPYVGLGIGAGGVWTDGAALNITNPAPPPAAARLESSANDVVIAGQGLLGLEMQIHTDWALFMEYKFLYLHEVGLKGESFELDYDYIGQSFVSAGLKFYLP